MLEGGQCRAEGDKWEEKKWDNCSSIINRIYLNKMPKAGDGERILEAAGEKQRVTYKVVPTGLSADFLKEALQGRRD